MSREPRIVFGKAADDRSPFDLRIGPQCAATAASIVVILVALALVALL